ncbi:hypothetical protein ACFQ1L_17035 [Phytohabitans flavus]|uniref:hypothetical protein n=1 Tax=Phytohabitans flavus TaxID=1076124 RepID=UPI003636F780
MGRRLGRAGGAGRLLKVLQQVVIMVAAAAVYFGVRHLTRGETPPRRATGTG